MQAYKGRKQSTALPSYDIYEPQQPQGCNSGICPHLGSNQQLPNWASDQLNKREIIPGTETLPSYPGLMKLWILEKNLYPPSY